MADSNITKRALAAALKEVMEQMPFAKVSISDICEKCDMNRKSFYYHFKDKYDLLNWIFDTECIALVNINAYDRRIDLLLELCRYFYENHRFYCSALQVRGQNSFLEHFHEIIYAVITVHLEEIFEMEEMPEFCVNVLADGFTCAIVRWMQEKQPMPPEHFVNSLAALVKGVSIHVCDMIKMRQSEEKSLLQEKK